MITMKLFNHTTSVTAAKDIAKAVTIFKDTIANLKKVSIQAAKSAQQKEIEINKLDIERQALLKEQANAEHLAEKISSLLK